MKYRKKPVIIEAVQFSSKEIPTLGKGTEKGAIYKWANGVYTDFQSPTGYSIYTLEGKHEVAEGDWIITGVKGEKYPCKPDIFKMTYEKV